MINSDEEKGNVSHHGAVRSKDERVANDLSHMGSMFQHLQVQHDEHHLVLQQYDCKFNKIKISLHLATFVDVVLQLDHRVLANGLLVH